MVAPASQGPSSVVPTETSTPAISCALCGLPAPRRITETFEQQEQTFCCYGCRHIYTLIWPDLAQGMDLRQAMGRAGLDLKAVCCRGIITGDVATEAATTLSRLMLNAFLAMMVMVLSLALYSDFFFAAWGEGGQTLRSMLQTLMMLFATPAVLLLALPIVEDAVLTFQCNRRLTTSALIALGSVAAYGLSVYATFTGRGHTYFETATMTLLLVTLGRWLDLKTQAEGNQAVDELLARTPSEACVITTSGQEIRTPMDQLRVGDRLRVRPGESLAGDARVVSGASSVDEASVTGESTPAYKGPGDTVYAGTLNLDGSLVLEATQVGDERVLGKLVRLLEEARLQRAPLEQLADRVAAYFAPLVMLVAVATCVYWTWHVDFAWGLRTSLAVLLIACPCALGIATPLTIWVALGRAAQQGVLIRDSRTLETLAHVRRVFLDKTGTLTTNRSTLQDIITDAGPLAPNPARLLQLAASLEQGSEHPLAQAVRDAAQTQGLMPLPVEHFRAITGRGVTARVEGVEVFVGSWRLARQQQLKVSDTLQRERQRLEQAGLSVVHVGWEGQVQGLLGFAEHLRPTAATAVAEMHHQGLDVQVLTGDRAAAGRALGQRLGVAVQSELLPPEKVEAIERAESNGPVVMVGDGLNDAPALARASVGMALGCGADVTREAADISLLGDDLTQVTWTLALARRVYRTIGWNLLWAFVYNVVGMAVAMAGWLHPVLAASAMVLSSALVVGNALRLRRF